MNAAGLRGEQYGFAVDSGNVTSMVRHGRINLQPNAESIQEMRVAVNNFNVLRETKKAGKGVVGMKILGQGGLRNKTAEALQFALAQDCLDAFSIGSESRGEMEDLVKKIPDASVRG